MTIEASRVSKQFGSFTALDDVDLHVRDGELVALLGPSGSGKTTLLRIIAGLDWPDSGEVRFDGQDALDRTIGERHVGFVFQHYALFRHMSVFENVAFGLRVRPKASRFAEAEIAARVRRLLDLVQIGWLADRYPAQLSGGQRQRVALARALAIEPRVLLLDEPFGALDAKVRKELRRWLRSLHDEISVTSLFVTHDQEEALEVADRVVVMNAGKIEQVGTPQEVYEQPATAFVHDFIGSSVALDVEIKGDAVLFGGRPIRVPRTPDVGDGRARFFARPYEFKLAEGETGLSGTVRTARRLGAADRIELELDGQGQGTRIEVELPRRASIVAGERLNITPRSFRLYRAEG